MVAPQRFLLVAVTLMWLASPATAQETGSISGAVFDAGGQPVEGAVVKVSGPQLPGGRTATTGPSGIYQFLRLIPGEYTVEATRADVGTQTRQVVIELDRTAMVDFVLGLALQETIDVTATRSAVDLRKAEVNLNYTADRIKDLPLERTYRGLFQLVPGVADNRSTVGPSAGGSRQDNVYLIDGVNITNPSYGTLATEVNELDLAEFNVKRGGITAEFGRASGIVTNAVSRSGTNTFAGQARLDWQPQTLIGDYEDDAFTDPLLAAFVNPAASLGGPILRDKVFFYGSWRYLDRARGGGRTNLLGTPLPDNVYTGHEWFGKVTSTPTPQHLLTGSFRDFPFDEEGGNAGPSTTPEVTHTSENTNRVATAGWSFFPTGRSTVDVKFLYLQEGGEIVPVTDLGYLPTFNVSNLAAMGYYQDPTKNNVRFGGSEFSGRIAYQRKEIKGTFTQFLDFGGSTHEIKAGGGYEYGDEDYFRLTNGWGDLVPQVSSGRAVIRARYYFEQPPQLGQGRTWSLFLQDNISIGRRLTVNAGVLFNQDEFAQDLDGSNGCPTTVALKGGNAPFESDGDRCTFVRYSFGDQVQPRLGANYALRDDQGDKVYVNWGRYYSTDQKSSSRSLAPRRIYQREAFFDATTGALISDAPRAATTGKLIDPAIEPTYSDELLFGYATRLAGTWSLDAFFQYRDFNDFIEDVPSIFPATGPYGAANLPCEIWEACRFEAWRTYQAFTTELRGRATGGLNTTVSYTWSRLEGNIDQDYGGGTAIFNTSSILQDGPGTFVQDEFREGLLSQDRPHVFKVFADYTFLERFSLGGYLRVQSGTPWQARGPDTQGGNYMNYLEPAGSRRNPTWTNFDLRAAYRLRFGGTRALNLEARALNLFGNQTQLSADERQYLTLNRISTPPYIGPPLNPNPLFGTSDQYAPPRRLVVGAGVSF